MGWSEDLLAEAGELLADTVALRRRIHRSPEIGNDLPETRQTVLDALSHLDLEIQLCQRTSGLIATLRGAERGRSILLRADMDALPMPEDTGLDYASSKPGRMHACGHDAHTAMLLSAAALLASKREQLAGDVKFFFQPGEEGHFGAKLMLDEELLAGTEAPRAAFAIHVDPRLPVGCVASRPGAVMASADVWTVEIVGAGGHASMPHDTLDPIPVACEIVNTLQTMVTRRISACDPVVITTTKIEAGTAANIIPESAKLLGTLRATSEHARLSAEEGIHRVVQGIAQAHGVEATVNVIEGYPVTFNEPDFTDFARGVATNLFGEDAYLDLPTPIMGAEDFSFLLQRWPGTFVFLGLKPRGVKKPAPCHSNRMLLEEAGLAHGVALHAAVAMRFLSDAGEAQ